jgi:hypothetical protein
VVNHGLFVQGHDIRCCNERVERSGSARLMRERSPSPRRAHHDALFVASRVGHVDTASTQERSDIVGVERRSCRNIVVAGARGCDGPTGSVRSRRRTALLSNDHMVALVWRVIKCQLFCQCAHDVASSTPSYARPQSVHVNGGSAQGYGLIQGMIYDAKVLNSIQHIYFLIYERLF